MEILLVVFVTALIFNLVYFKMHRVTLSNARYMETLSIGDIEQKLYDMQKLESDYRHYSEVKGKVKADSIIVAPLTMDQCIYYCLVIKEKYKVRKAIKSDKGIRYIWVDREDTVKTIIDSVKMYIEDETSVNKLFIDEDNNFDLSVNKRAIFNPYDHFVLKFGLRANNSYSRKTIGYVFIEKILRSGDSVYILGDGYFQGENLCIGSASRKGSIGVVTTKTEEELIKSYSTGSIINIVVVVISILGIVWVLKSLIWG